MRAAKSSGDRRLSILMETICGTGIRISELRFITAEAVGTGRAQVCCKGKCHTVFLPEALRQKLQSYLKAQKRTAGPVFVTKTGRPLDRSNIWRDMKKLCQAAVVAPGKVFPHNLRHLFARTYYSIEKDLSRLVDILGHSSVSTTRIYTVESGTVHARQLARMGSLQHKVNYVVGERECGISTGQNSGKSAAAILEKQKKKRRKHSWWKVIFHRLHFHAYLWAGTHKSLHIPNSNAISNIRF